MPVTIAGNSNLVLQVVNVTTNNTGGYTRGTTITPLSISITPTNVNSKILVLLNGCWGTNTTSDVAIDCNRNGTQLQSGTGGSSTNATWVPAMGLSSAATFQGTLMLLDSPSSTSLVTYTFISQINANTLYLNRRGAALDFASSSMVTLMEIAS